MEARRTPGTNGSGPRSDESIAELMKRLSEQTTELVRKEIELGKAELQEKGKKAGVGAGMFGGAGVFGFYAFGALTATFILALATAVDGWLAALIVTAVYGAVAGVLALTGKNKVQEATPPVPERAIDSTKADVQVAKERAQAGRN
jgi:MFS family permease